MTPGDGLPDGAAVYMVRTTWGARMRFAMNPARAELPIVVAVGTRDGWAWRPTAYCTADAQHDPDLAAQLVILTYGRDWYAGTSRDFAYIAEHGDRTFIAERVIASVSTVDSSPS